MQDFMKLTKVILEDFFKPQAIYKQHFNASRVVNDYVIAVRDDDTIIISKENDLNVKRFREVLGKAQEVLEYF